MTLNLLVPTTLRPYVGLLEMVEAIMSSPHLKRRSEVHWARKIWHIGTVFMMYLIWAYAPEKVSLAILALACLLFIPIDFLRQIFPALNDVMVHAFKPIMRQGEEKRLAGTTYLLIGVVFIVSCFSRPVVSLTLLFLAFADPIASLVGIKFGRDKIFGHKSLQGFLAAYAVCAILSFLYLSGVSEWDRVLVFSLIAGLVGALAELIPLWKIDDNFTLPVFSALGLHVLFYFFGFFATTAI